MPVIRVQVKPRSRESSLTHGPDGAYLARVKAPPVDGLANAEVQALIARHFGCPKSAVRLESGAGARYKRFQVPESPSGSG
jgi:uncharacterized protein YggU (UPF0235/DUF167 family)